MELSREGRNNVCPSVWWGQPVRIPCCQLSRGVFRGGKRNLYLGVLPVSSCAFHIFSTGLTPRSVLPMVRYALDLFTSLTQWHVSFPLSLAFLLSLVWIILGYCFFSVASVLALGMQYATAVSLRISVVVFKSYFFCPQHCL